MALVVDCEARVSLRKTLKHLPARLVSVRLMPPSKSSPWSSELSRPDCLPLLFVSHGVEIVLSFETAQTGSPREVVEARQSPPTPPGTGFSVPLAPPVHR